MDSDVFDRLSRAVAGASVTRRGIAAVLGVGALRATWPEQSAAKKHKKNKHRCIKAENVCDPNAGKTCCTGPDMCCRPDPFLGETEHHCAPPSDKDQQFFCCPAPATGWCSLPDLPQCCPGSDRLIGGCAEAEGECCTKDPIGGSCPPGYHCCFDPAAEPRYTCCTNAKADAAATPARALRLPRNFYRPGR